MFIIFGVRYHADREAPVADQPDRAIGSLVDWRGVAGLGQGAASGTDVDCSVHHGEIFGVSPFAHEPPVELCRDVARRGNTVEGGGCQRAADRPGKVGRRCQYPAEGGGQQRCRYAVAAHIQQVKRECMLIDAQDVENVARHKLGRAEQPVKSYSAKLLYLLGNQASLYSGRRLKILFDDVVGFLELAVLLLQGALQGDDAGGGVDARFEFLLVKRFADKIVGSRLQAGYQVVGHVAGGKEYDVNVVRHVGRADAAAQADPVQFRHHPVGNDDVRTFGADQLPAVFAVSRTDSVVSPGGEETVQ